MNGTFHHVLLHPCRRRQLLKRKIAKAAAAGAAAGAAFKLLGEAALRTRDQIEETFAIPAEAFQERDRRRERRRVQSQRNRKNRKGRR